MLLGVFVFKDEIVFIELSFVLNNLDSFNLEFVKVYYCSFVLMFGGRNYLGSIIVN